jgi:hypothetical protein
MTKDEVISNMCKLAVNYKAVNRKTSRDKSVYDWVRESGWLSYKNNISVEDIKGYLKSKPQLINDWLGYSSDKRSTLGWYFIENDKEMTSFTVGWFEGRIEEKNETKYPQAIDALAQFILNEFKAFLINNLET